MKTTDEEFKQITKKKKNTKIQKMIIHLSNIENRYNTSSKTRRHKYKLSNQQQLNSSQSNKRKQITDEMNTSLKEDEHTILNNNTNYPCKRRQ